MYLIVKKSTLQVKNDRQSSHNPSQKYRDKRLANAVKMYGGSASDYDLIAVPQGQEAQAMSALYITYNGEEFTFQPGARYTAAGGTITIKKQWMRGNDMLLADDDTDFTSLTEDSNFALDAYIDDSTGAISIEPFLWGITEDKGPGPGGKTYLQTVCSGAYDATAQTFHFGGSL